MTDLSDAEVLDAYPTSFVDRDNIAMYRGFMEHQLVIQRCADCGKWTPQFYPNCPYCWSDNVQPAEVSGKGTVFTFTILHTGPYLEGVDYAAGHPLVVVELPEQPALRVTGTIVNCPLSDIRIDMPVKATWITRGGQQIPAFEPA